MLENEARWLGEQLAAFADDELFPLVNVGSSTGEFRTRVQPHIDGLVFAPLRARGGSIVHLDAKAAPGVDVVGDLREPETFDALRARAPRSLVISNLLEHVDDPGAVTERLTALVPSGGLLFVTGPQRFPYHADPIDTMLRPTPAAAAALFPGTELVTGATIAGGSFLDWEPRDREGWSRAGLVLRLAVPFVRPAGWRVASRHTRYLFGRLLAFGVVLRTR